MYGDKHASPAGMMPRQMSRADNSAKVSSEVTRLGNQRTRDCQLGVRGYGDRQFGFRRYLAWETKPLSKPAGASRRNTVANRLMSYVTRNQVYIVVFVVILCLICLIISLYDFTSNTNLHYKKENKNTKNK